MNHIENVIRQRVYASFLQPAGLEQRGYVCWDELILKIKKKKKKSSNIRMDTNKKLVKNKHEQLKTFSYTAIACLLNSNAPDRAAQVLR